MIQKLDLGLVRAYWLGCVVCIGGFLFGYDSGIVGGVLKLASFQKDFDYGQSQQTFVSSMAVSLQNLGAFVACGAAWPITNRFGRKRTLMVAATVFCIGVIIQTVNTQSRPAFYVGRVIAGLGLGVATVVVPMYSSEMCPAHLRGKIGCFFQLFYTLGIFTSYWVDYGVEKDLGNYSKQWQIPIALQLIPAALLGLGMFTLEDSVRWYEKRGEHFKAEKSLVWIRGGDSKEVQEEMQQIRVGVRIEIKKTEGFGWSELLHHRYLKLTLTSFLVFLAQQATGATALAYYAPQYFTLIVGGSGEQSLLLSGIFGAVKVVACATFVFFLSERIGRKFALTYGALLMAIFHFIVAAVVKTHPPPPSKTDAHVTSSGIATIAMIYLFVIVYNMSWGSLPWPYVSEIFPTRCREPGVAVGVASQWLFNFVFTLVSPYMIHNIRYGTFLVWGCFNIVICICTALLLKETRGLPLEVINAQFLDAEDELNAQTQRSDGILPPRQDSLPTTGKPERFSGSEGSPDGYKGTGRTRVESV